MASRARFFAFLAALLLALGALPAATAPTHIARAMGTTTAPYGYMEYLPSAYYDNATVTYPLVLFLHGLGEEGAGTDPVALLPQSALETACCCSSRARRLPSSYGSPTPQTSNTAHPRSAQTPRHSRQSARTHLTTVPVDLAVSKLAPSCRP